MLHKHQGSFKEIMKKFIYILLLIALGWLIKLSYDFYQVSQQLSDIQQSLHNSEQKNATLNDQLVAVQRQTSNVEKSGVEQVSVTKEPAVGIHASALIKQKLELVQFAMQQQQFVYAVEHLTQLDQSLDQYALADALKHSLHQTIQQDIQNIQQFVIEVNTQREQLDAVLKQIDQSLISELKNNQLKPEQAKNEYFWEKWLQVDRVKPELPALANRKFILKEMQLRVLLAQQLMIRGQNAEFQAVLDQVTQAFDLLPDAFSQKIKQQLLKVKQNPQLPAPKLNSLAVLG